MKKLLFVIFSLGLGGAERSLINLLNELPENQYAVDVLLFQRKGAFLDYVPKWINVLETPTPLDRLYAPVSKVGRYTFTKVIGTFCSKVFKKKRKEQLAYRWRYFYRGKIGMLSGHYDVAIAYGGTENLYYVHDCVNANKKIVWIHNDYRTGGYSKQDDYAYLERMDAIVSISKQCVDVLKKEFPEFINKIYCIENITSSTMVLKQAETVWPQEFRSDMINILSIGRLSPQKGFDLAVEAAAILKNSGVKFNWYIMGDGPLRKEITMLIHKKNVEDCFFLLGTRSNPYPYIKECDLFVQTSRYEGKSVVLDEAKILTKPIVVTNYPTVRDQIKHGREGLIADMHAEDIAQKIISMLTDIHLRESIKEYLNSNEYGNCDELEKYVQVWES